MKRYLLLLMSLIGWTSWTFAVTAEGTYPLQTSTLSHVSSLEAVHDVRVSRHTVSFKLDDPIWHYTYNKNPINFVGSQVKITTVTLPDIATNTTNLPNVPSVSILDETGKVLATSTSCTPQSTTIPLASIDGSHVDVKPYIYAFSPAVPLDTSKTYTLRLNPNNNLTTPLLPVFRNASSEYTDADTSVVRIDGSAEGITPYLAFDGEMTMTRFTYDLSAGTHSLKDELEKDKFADTNDNQDTMVIVRLKAMDTILTVDRSLTKAAMIVATDTPATTWNQEGTGDWTVDERAGTVRFLDGYTFTGPLDFRDVSNSTNQSDIRMLRLEYNGATSPVIPRSVWNPEDFALSCDLELSAYPDMTPETKEQQAWFGRNPITIPSGRSVRIVTHVNEANIPQITFADATSRLALAIPTNEAHVLSHYRELIENNSGILRMVSPFKIKTQTTDANKEHPISLILGVDNDAKTAPSIQTIESYNKTTFESAFVLGYGVDNKAQYVQHTGNVSIGGEGLFIGQANPALAKYFLKDGQLKTDRVTFGHKAHDAALIVGDGEGDANSAVATLSQLLASDVSNTTEITGTAEVIINTDGQLVLNGDLDMTPALRRRMTMNGGTLKAKGATPAYTFGTDFVNGGGLSINGDVTIDASEATPRFQKAAAVNADMKMEFEDNNTIVAKNSQDAWFAEWGGNAPSSYIVTPSGKGFTVSNIVNPYVSITPPAESDYSFVLGANLENVTAENAVLFSVGSWNNALALRKRGNTIEVIRYDSNYVTTVDASYTSDTLAKDWHLFVVSVDHDIYVDVTEGEDGKDVITKTITATKVTLYVDGVPMAGTILTPFIFSEYPGFQIGAGYSNAGYNVVADGMQVDNCYIWDRALTAGEVRALRPTLTIDALSGAGSVTIDGTVTINNLGYFKGTIQAQAPSSETALDGGSIRINALHGITSDITFGYLGRRDTSVVADILALTHKEGLTPYRGVLSFDATQYPLVNVSETEELDVYARLRIQNGQTLRIRLDQFADATILWPEQIDKNNPPKLEIVEAGAYGGELIIPHLPEEVADSLVFYHYDHNNILVPHYQNTWTITPNEDGAYDTFEWEYPNFAHNSAWIDAEFEGNSYNTGWMRVGKKNALLKGTDWNNDGSNLNSYGQVMTETKFFTDTRNPAGKGVKLCYRPYIELSDLKYPKVWSAAIRLTAPRKANTTLLALSSTCGGAYYPKLPDGDALILATGETVGETGPIPIVLYHAIDHAITGETYNVAAADELVPVATAYIADISEIPHVISAVCDGKTLTVYLDGGFLTEYDLPDNWVGLATGGLQVGQILSGSSNTGQLNNLRSAEPNDGGYVDYIRFYKGALTATAMAALAEEAPPVHQGVRYIRHVTTDGDWEYPLDGTTKPWLKQVWATSTQQWTNSGYHARPSEGAEIRLFVNGNHTLQINTEKDSTNGFLSANRLYSALNVLPHTDATTTPKLTLQPIGGEVTLAGQNTHPWMTAKNGSNWQYGTIKFVGGGGDTIHPKAACEAEAYDNPHSALGVHGRRSVSTETVGGTPTLVSDDVVPGAESKAESTSNSNNKWQKTRTVTQTRIYRRNFTGGDVAAYFVPSSGVTQFSRLASVLVGGVSTTTGTETMTATRTITQTQTGLGKKNNITWSNVWEPAYNKDSDTNWSAWNETGWTTESIADGDLVPATLELRADFSLIREREDEERDFLHLTGKIEGRGNVVGNTLIEKPNTNGQISDYVWVPAFNEGANWLVSDVTNTIYGENSNPGGTVAGLLAEIRQIPGRLYLDLSDTDFQNARDFFEAYDAQAKTGLPWYRYGYKGENASPTPILATQTDMETAIAFQLRVPTGTWTIHANKRLEPSSSRLVATLHVESSAADDEAVPTLKMLTTSDNGTLVITKQLITSVRLEDIGETLNGALTGTPTLTPLESAFIHGHTTGTYAFKNRTFSRAMLNDSIATLEAHGTQNFFWHNFELRNTNLVIADGAILEQTEADNHLWAKSLTMGKDATFRFHAAGPDEGANGVVFSGNVTLLGNATLHGYGQVDQANGTPNATRCNFTANAIVGPAETPIVLTVNSAGEERWICYTADIQGGNVGLTKVGTGIMAFRSPSAPSFTGSIKVNEGILRVGTTPISSDVLKNDEHTGTSIGHKGLHVAAGASLEPNHYANAEDLIACIPSGQTLSGTGTISGVLRLNSGATLKDCAGMTIRKMVVDGSTSPDIQVILPSDIAEQAILFHMLEDSARAEVRRRFYATRNGVRWDVCVNHEKGIDKRPCLSHYWVQSPRVPVPTGLTTNDGNAFTDAFTNTMTRYYQGYSVSRLLSSTGYTKYVNADSNHKLNAAEIENAFNCFSHVWTFDKDEAKNTLNSAYVDDEASLLMAYEFGITRMDVRDIGETRYLIVEVKVENALGKAFGNHVTGANNVADFQLNTQVAFYRVHEDEETAPTPVNGVQEIVSFDATDLTGPSEQTHTPGFRAFAIPFDEAHFPMGTTSLSVKVTL